MEKKRINLTTTDYILGRIDELANENGVTRSSYISLILKQHIDSQDMLRLANKDKLDKEEMVQMLEGMKELVQNSPERKDK